MLDRDLTIFNFNLVEIKKALYEDDLFLLNEAFDANRIYGPYKKLIGSVIKYYFKSAKNNLYVVNFVKLGKKRYVVSFNFIKNITTDKTNAELSGETSKKAIKKSKLGDNYYNLDFKEQFETLKFVFEIIKKFMTKFSPNSVWLEPVLTSDEDDKISNNSSKPKKGKNKFELSKRGRIYKNMAKKGVKGTNFEVTNDDDFLVLYDKSKYKNAEDVINKTPNASIIVSYVLDKISSLMDSPPKEVYETLGQILINQFNNVNS